MFEPSNWDERYSGEEKIWSGNPNEQLVAEVSSLTVGSALDVGCGEGGDVIWLASRGWRVTGADALPARPSYELILRGSRAMQPRAAGYQRLDRAA
jgi:SAM-dependent methyltransferase